jgi:acyl-coenzyme A thioesterase PaaI-like protein
VNCAFLSAAFPPYDLIAVAEVMKGGRRLAYGQVSVYSNERLVAHCTLNFMNLNADRR